MCVCYLWSQHPLTHWLCTISFFNYLSLFLIEFLYFLQFYIVVVWDIPNITQFVWYIYMYIVHIGVSVIRLVYFRKSIKSYWKVSLNRAAGPPTNTKIKSLFFYVKTAVTKSTAAFETMIYNNNIMTFIYGWWPRKLLIVIRIYMRIRSFAKFPIVSSNRIVLLLASGWWVITSITKVKVSKVKNKYIIFDSETQFRRKTQTC